MTTGKRVFRQCEAVCLSSLPCLPVCLPAVYLCASDQGEHIMEQSTRPVDEHESDEYKGLLPSPSEMKLMRDSYKVHNHTTPHTAHYTCSEHAPTNVHARARQIMASAPTPAPATPALSDSTARTHVRHLTSFLTARSRPRTRSSSLVPPSQRMHGAKNAFSVPFYTKTEPFTKTCSGQT